MRPGVTQWPVSRGWVVDDLLGLLGTVRGVQGPSGFAGDEGGNGSS